MTRELEIMKEIRDFLKLLDFCIFKTTSNSIQATDFVSISLIIVNIKNNLFTVKIVYPNKINKSFIFKSCTKEEIKNIIKNIINDKL